MTLAVKLQVFEGPLDLLLHLIDINKIDIYDIPIALITDQYLEYIRQMQEQDMEVMSEFLVMAATLLRIKSKMLLPEEPKEVDFIRPSIFRLSIPLAIISSICSIMQRSLELKM